MTFVNTVPSYCGREMGYFLVGHQACVDCHSALAGMRSSADWKTFAVKSARIPGARKGRSDRSTSDQRLPVLQHNGGNKRLSDPPDATEDDSDFAEAPARGGEEVMMDPMHQCLTCLEFSPVYQWVALDEKCPKCGEKDRAPDDSGEPEPATRRAAGKDGHE